MGLFGFIGEIASAAVKVVASPIAIVKDASDILEGNEANNTSNLIESIGDNIEDGFDKLTGEH
jgi:hypothetical protein